MSVASQSKEPSMDEILASIRRIIESGDDRKASRQSPDRARPSAAAAVFEPETWTPPVRAAPAVARASPPRIAWGDGSVASADPETPVNSDMLDELGIPAADAAFARDVHVDPDRAPEDADDRGPAPEAEAPWTAAARPVPDGDPAPPVIVVPSVWAAVPAAGPPAPAQEDEAAEDAAFKAGVLAAADDAWLLAPEETGEPADELLDLDFDEERFVAELRLGAGLDDGEGAGAGAGRFDGPPVPLAAVAAPEPAALLSQDSGARVAAAFEDLALAIRDGQMRSMDELAREMLRPMLQGWLDDNLPHLVERLVREEIERVARGGRR